MSTDLQKTMQKVQLVSPEGVIFRPRNRVLCLLDSIAGHTHHEAPHRGVCLSRETLGKHGMNKSKETVSLAAKEAESCGLIRRASVKPKPGVRFQAPVYYLDARLIEAADTAYKGDLLVFKAPFEPPGKQGGSSELKSANAKVQHRSAKLAKLAIRKAAAEVNKPKKSVSRKENEVKHCIKPQAHNYCTMEVQGTRPRPHVAAAVPALPALPGPGLGCPVVSPPHGGAGAGGIQLVKDIQQQGQDVKACAARIFENVGDGNGGNGDGGELVEFLRFMGDADVELDFQARRSTVDARGARLWQKLGDDPAVAFCKAVEAPARLLYMQWHLVSKKQKKRLEGVLHVLGDHSILLLDDLDPVALAAVGQWWQGARAAIETSPGNYQAFLKADRPLTSAQRLACQRALAARFGCDGGAVGGVQMHRYPGSINHKNGGSWCTRLVAIRDAQGGDVGAQVDELLAAVPTPASAPQVKPDQQKTQQPQRQNGGGDDPSRAAFNFAFRQLKAGVSPDMLASQIAERFNTNGKHTRGQDGGIGWAKRTIESTGVKVLKRPAGWYLSRISV